MYIHTPTAVMAISRALEVDVLSEILRVCDSRWTQVGVLTWKGGWFHYRCGPRWVLHLGIL